MNRKQEELVPDMRLKGCELFELVHVVRVRAVLKESQKGICLEVCFVHLSEVYHVPSVGLHLGIFRSKDLQMVHGNSPHEAQNKSHLVIFVNFYWSSLWLCL